MLEVFRSEIQASKATTDRQVSRERPVIVARHCCYTAWKRQGLGREVLRDGGDLQELRHRRQPKVSA